VHLSTSRWAAAVVAAVLLLGAAPAPAHGETTLSCRACLALDDTGGTLYQRRAGERMPNASTTKMVTALVVTAEADLDETVTVSGRAAATPGAGLALEEGADIVIMVHPDYQYTPKLIPSIAHLISSELYEVVLGSRILGKGALKGGMPLYKYIANRFLTLTQNILMGQKLSEYHTGYRAFSRQVLESIDYHKNSDDFVFDNQMLAQIFFAGYEIAEITCPTKYFEEASSINFKRSSIYGLGVLKTSFQYFLQKKGIANFKFLNPSHLCTQRRKREKKKTLLVDMVLIVLSFVIKKKKRKISVKVR
jgi:hypothetical protein